MQFLSKLILSLLPLIISSCITIRHVAGYEPNVRQLKPNDYGVVGSAEAIASNFNLLWFFSVTPLANFDRAISEAINQKSGDDLIDVSWYIERQYWIIGTINIIHIKGKVIKYKE